ncbi:LysR substrate-binding domain-containing protein [Aminobacter sp. AP02]|uniref:LysR family transcriptional regulator n=1 Tax=Aminobacter sp. AP02 TaxID=2135737 RepID=UPI000D6C750C|nr:LysR substrate-binding domain-containing protein [Aminobacter sp. AP02]PWK72704.1 DNA-binding transcriptional LysR family regulator [Aminobacter sp. AP02]
MTKKRLMPQLRALQSFEAVARHASVSDAAQELGVTQSAISHQIRRLSEELGERLVERQGRGLVLTSTGRRLASELDHAFDLIERSAAQVVGATDRTIRLAVYGSFASGWLVPRLPQFFSRHPDIDLELVMVSEEDEISDKIADAFVTSRPSQRGYRSVLLMREQLVAVCAPEFGSWPCPLITTEVSPSSNGTDWIEFCRRSGLELTRLQRQGWKLCTHYALALEMARAGIGAALIPDFMAEQDVAEGKLARLPGEPMPTGQHYFLSVKFSRHQEPALAGLSKWLRATVR